MPLVVNIRFTFWMQSCLHFTICGNVHKYNMAIHSFVFLDIIPFCFYLWWSSDYSLDMFVIWYFNYQNVFWNSLRNLPPSFLSLISSLFPLLFPHFSSLVSSFSLMPPPFSSGPLISLPFYSLFFSFPLLSSPPPFFSLFCLLSLPWAPPFSSHPFLFSPILSILGIEHESSRRALNALNHWVISSAP